METTLSYKIEILGRETQISEITKIEIELKKLSEKKAELSKQEKLLRSQNAESTQSYRQILEQLIKNKKASLELNNVKKKLQSTVNLSIKENQVVTGSLNDMRLQLSNLQQKFADMPDVLTTNKEKGIALAKQINSLNNNVKSLEESTGVHTRSVGNYARAFEGLTGVLGVVGKAFGIDEGMINKLVLAHSALREGISGVSQISDVLKNRTISKTAATITSTTATKAETVATEGQTIAQKALNAVRLYSVPILGWIAAGVTALIAVGVIYKEEIFGISKAEEEHRRALDGVMIKDDELRETYNDSIKTIKEVTIRHKILIGVMSEEEGALETAKNKYVESLDTIKKETAEKLDKVTGVWHKMWLKIKYGGGISWIEKNNEEILTITAEGERKRNNLALRSAQEREEIQHKESASLINDIIVSGKTATEKENDDYLEKKKILKKALVDEKEAKKKQIKALEILEKTHTQNINKIKYDEAKEGRDKLQKLNEEAAADRKKIFDDREKLVNDIISLNKTATEKENDEYLKKKKQLEKAFVAEKGATQKQKTAIIKLNKERIKALALLEMNHIQNLDKINKEKANKQKQAEAKKLAAQKQAIIDLEKILDSGYKDEIELARKDYLLGIITKEQYNKKLRELNRKRIEDEIKQLDNSTASIVNMSTEQNDAVIEAKKKLYEELGKLDEQYFEDKEKINKENDEKEQAREEAAAEASADILNGLLDLQKQQNEQRLKEDVKVVDDAEKAKLKKLDDATKKALKDLDAKHKAGLISDKAYEKQKEAIETKAEKDKLKIEKAA